MAGSGPFVIVTRRLPEPVEAALAARFEAELNRDDRAFGAEALAAAAGRCDVLVPTVTDRVDSAAIGAGGGRLRLIANFGAGTDHIDLDAARRAGVAVTNTPDVLTEDTADIAIALILATARRLSEGERLLRAGRWTGWAPTNLMGRGLAGKRLAIVGMGRIGRALAARARAFGLAIHYHSRRRLPQAAEATLDARWWRELDAMLGEADIVSVNCPYGPETHHLIDRRRLALIKPDAILVNTARAAIVDQEALIAALASGALAGAGLDVYPAEPQVDPRLLALPNAVLLPHLGSATIESRTAMGMKVLANIEAFAEGRDLPDRVA
jgi:glyoxylate reductase